MRNPDPTYKRYTSLAWAAVLGHEETFEWLLNTGHDDQEVSRPQDSQGNTILILLAEAKPPLDSPYSSGPAEHDFYSATLRMARMYYDRYPEVLDWANTEGRTAVHAAALKGNEDILRMLCDLGADFDLADNDGNTPLHFASAWGHVTIVQLLIERGCQYSVRNNDGFTPSDYAYSMSTRDVLQDTARAQFELNKKARRNVYAQAAARGNEWTSDEESLSARARILNGSARVRSGSGTSRTTATSDSGGDWIDTQSTPGQFRHIAPAPFTSSPSRNTVPLPLSASSTSATSFSVPSPQPPSTLSPGPNVGVTGLSPIASRMRERDAEAMEKYKMRQRSGSAATTSTDAPSLTGSNVSSGNASANGEEVTSLNSFGSFAPRRRLRPSASAAQLSNGLQPLTSATPPNTQDSRHRAGTSPGILKRHPSTSTATTSPPSEGSSVLQTPTQASSTTSRPNFFRSVNGLGKDKDKDKDKDKEKDYSGLSPPAPTQDTPERERSHTPTLLHSRRLPFNLLSHKHSTDHHHFGHKRNTSANSLISRT
ncbi:hypothetical protein NM688_g2935 [Phlebia brevispora]|uniref:Uncharacterized protein n=1 Tax=Phlebia brevispora TaxID=194682 RepID=A0ACC1T734_9APHY|nr:hypothetical protein NM688_g2935 [Phlebia brevispora]